MSARFVDCSTIEVSGGEYSAVALSTAGGGSRTYEAGYEGQQSFSADGEVEQAVVWTGQGKISLRNPDLEACTATPTPDPYAPDRVRENAQNPSYDEFFRNFEKYRGEPVTFTWGYIVYTNYGSSRDFFQIEVKQGDDEQYQGDIGADWYGDTRFIEDDILNPLYGVAEELWTYETVRGDERTVPRIRMVDAELYEG